MTKNEKEKDISASALEIYIYLLKKNPEPLPIGQLKDALGLPKSTLHYNLTVLQKQGLIEETPTGYIIKQFEQLPALKHYISFFGKILPRYVLFSVFFSLMTLLLAVSELVPQIKILSVVLAIVGLIWTLLLVRKYRL